MIDSKVTKKGSILIYTRTPVASEYSSHLANSAHFAYSFDGKHFLPLNQNYGILYSKATVGYRNSLNEKGLTKPYLFNTANGHFGIIAVKTNADGSNDEESKGKLLLWTSEDLICFREHGYIDLQKDAFVQEAVCSYDSENKVYAIHWRDFDGNLFSNSLPDLNNIQNISSAKPGNEFVYASAVQGPEGAVNGNILTVDSRVGDKLLLKWSSLKNVEVRVPELIRASTVEEVNAVAATAVYSDGSTSIKQVKWDTAGIDFNKPGLYEIKGTVFQKEYPFPLAEGFADPDILQWKGKYYFIATNDNLDQVGLYVREADTVSGLFEKGAREYLILDKNEEKGFVQTFWAPEFHLIGDELYILFAVGGKKWGPQAHIMKLKESGSVIDPDSWEEPVRVCKMDGSYLTTEGITLDMTYLKVDEISYLVWSYRIWTGDAWSSSDSGSMLYIATIDPKEPWKLTSEPVLLSRPLLGWENNENTINNEGPYAIVTDEHVYLTYSGGAAGGYTYVLGLLTIRRGQNLLDPNNWTKSSAPVLSYYSVEGEYGPGHNSFYADEYGNLMMAYHAQDELKGTLRCTGIRRIHFNIEGEPVFDMSYERDMNPKLVKVTSQVIVQ